MARRPTFLAALLALIVLAASGPEAIDEPLRGWFDLEVAGGEAALTTLGLTLEERAFMIPVLARALLDRDPHMAASDVRLARTLADFAARARSDRDVISVPAPLDASVWRDLLPPVKPPATNDLFLRIVTNRAALLTAVGLMSTSDRVRALFARERDLLRFVYDHGHSAFAIVARRLDIADGAVVVPGGAGAESVWQSLVGIAPSQPDPFIRALLTKDQGRLAWYYDTIAGLSDAQHAAVWPSSAPASERGAALYPAFRDPDPQWRAYEQPFRRGAIDAWMIVTQNEVHDGVVRSPLPQATWALLFAIPRPPREQIARTLEAPANGVAVAWLARETLSPLVRERRTRYEMFRLAQRVFSAAPADALIDVALSVSALRQHRALAFTLERMQVRDPAVWAAVSHAARHVTDESDDRRDALVIFQATLALIERMRHARTLDVPATEHLLRSLSTAVRADKKVAQRLAAWLVSSLIPALPRLVRPDAFTGTTAYESTILQALAGPAGREVAEVEWEGLTYIADPVAAEHDRLKELRALLPSPGLDAALVAGRPRALADALTSLVYATALGDPGGPASLSPDVGSRHQLGLSSTALLREELPWAPPEERQGNGPWHVQGSLLGLDLAMSRLVLRRIADHQMPQAPTLTLNDVATLTRTAVGLVALDLRDDDRDELAAAIARGRARVAVARTTEDFARLAEECGMSATTRQLLVWVGSRQREELPHLFALRDLMWLGKPALSRAVLDRWGVSAEGLDGRRGLAMPGPSPWEDYAGRSEVGQVATQVPDLTLRLVEATARLRLPAELVPSLLAFALEDYWHDVQARYADDWLRLTRQAAALSDSRIHDYVAALAGGGPLRPQ